MDRNIRVKFAVRIRQRSDLTPATRLVAIGALFGITDSRTGRCRAFRSRLALEAGVSKRTVTRATNALEEAGILKVEPTYERRHRAEKNRWFKPRSANVLVWQIPPDLLSANLAAKPCPTYKSMTTAQLPADLSAALARLGNAMAAKREKENLQARD